MDESMDKSMDEKVTLSDDEMRAVIRKLTSEYCDDAISTEKFQSLERLVGENQVARREYLHLMKIHAELVSQGKQRNAVENESSVEKAIELAQTRQSPSVKPATLTRSMALLFVAIAASLMLLAAFTFTRSRGERSAPRIADRRQDNRASQESDAHESDNGGQPTASHAIGKIVTTSEMCRLFVGGVQVDAKAEIPLLAGQEICLAGGTAEIHFDNGIRSALQAPAILVPKSSMLVHLSEGNFTSTVSKSGIGFTVTTPEARVIDLGTSFGILAKLGGTTQVVVFDGEVDVMPYDAATPDEDADLVRLKMGDGVNLFSDGSIRPVFSISSSDYRMPGLSSSEQRQTSEEARRYSPIASVHDSLDRVPGRYSRYEIVVGGMREDVIAFADRRNHQWNGADETGMPEYLVGGDYVKMINDVRYINDYRVFITIDRPTSLYILADDRANPPKWLTDQFEDTGDNIGMDEGPHFNNTGTVLQRDLPGIGPGVSIDHLHSVWVKEISSPCTIECGAMLNVEQPFSAENNYNKAAYNHVLYGIVAVPK